MLLVGFAGKINVPGPRGEGVSGTAFDIIRCEPIALIQNPTVKNINTDFNNYPAFMRNNRRHIIRDGRNALRD